MRARYAPSRCKGFSLVELLVSLTLGIFLTAGAFLLYLSSRATTADVENLARMQENTRFASDFLVRDIRNAGFRDEGMLNYADWEQIGNEYVELDDPVYPLIIRYGGRGDCRSSFADDEFEIVENYYRIGSDAAGNPALICGDGTNNDVLVSGVSALEAAPLCPPGTVGCSCPGECIGLRIALELDSGSASGMGNRSVELKAVFRNIVYASFNAE